MLIAKGKRVLFDLESSPRSPRYCEECKVEHVAPPPSYGMLHDPDGEDWPRSSVLVMPYRKGSRSIDYAPARAYFGSGYRTVDGTTKTPAFALSSWERLGKVDRIWYTRGGVSHPGPFQHKVNKGWGALLFGKKRAILYKKGTVYRLEFPDGAEMDWRGFVTP